uniref:Uncharacterized protein n=1 Tax=Cucumis melo TaxID=3656 RepID=A0A9I9E884_CUCME
MLISFVVRSICSQSPFVLRGSNHAKLLYKVAAFDKRIGSKFLLESDPSSSNIEEFSKGLYDGTISPYFRSQSIPNNTFKYEMATVLISLCLCDLKDGASIEVVVGRTFDELDLKTTTKNVEKLAKHFKDFDNISRWVSGSLLSAVGLAWRKVRAIPRLVRPNPMS